MWILRLALWAVVSVSLILLAVGGFLGYRTSRFRQSAATASGTVIELVERVSHSDEGTSVVYAPRVQFRTSAGEERIFLSDTGSNPPAFAPGDPVEVLYNPDHPADARLNTFWQLWLGPVICVGIGIVFLVFATGFFILLAFLNRQRSTTPAVNAVPMRATAASYYGG